MDFSSFYTFKQVFELFKEDRLLCFEQKKFRLCLFAKILIKENHICGVYNETGGILVFKKFFMENNQPKLQNFHIISK